MHTRRNWLAALTVAMLATGGVAFADEGKRVRLELKDGTVVEGRLAEFESRAYLVRTAEGELVRVPESAVAQLSFPRQAEGPLPSACELSAGVIEEAARSGAIERVLGEHYFLFRDEQQAGPNHHGEDPFPAVEYLVLVSISRSGEPPEVQIELEILPKAGEKRGPDFMDVDAHGPSRQRFRFSPDGRFTRGEILSEEANFEWCLEGSRLAVSGESRGRRGERDWPWSDEILPRALVVFVLAPLHDQGLPSGFAFRMLGKNPDPVTAQRRLRARSRGDSEGPPTRVLEVTAERAGRAQKDSERLFLAEEGPWEGRLVRYETENWGSYNGVLYVHETVVGERIGADRFEQLVQTWGAKRAPSEAPSDVPEAVPPPSRDAVADLLVRARKEGALQRLVQERWYRVHPPRGDAEASQKRLEDHPELDAERAAKWAEELEAKLAAANSTRLIRVAGELTEESFSFEVEVILVGDPQGRQRYRYVWGSDGILRATHSEEPSLEGGRTVRRGVRRGDTLAVEVEQRGSGGAVTKAERDTVRLGPSAGGVVPELFVHYGLPLLRELLPPRLEVHGQLRNSRITRSLQLLRYPIDSDSEALKLAESEDALRRHTWPLPSEARPDEAFVVAWGGNEGRPPRPIGISWLRGGTLDSLVSGDASRESDSLTWIRAVDPNEVPPLQADAEAASWGSLLRRRANEAWVGMLLSQLTTKQASFRASDLDRDGAPDYAENLQELVEAGLVEGALSHGEVCGYKIEVGRAAVAPNDRWLAVANPIRPGVDGDWSYAVTQESVILRSKRPLALSEDARLPASAQPDPKFASFGSGR